MSELKTSAETKGAAPAASKVDPLANEAEPIAQRPIAILGTAPASKAVAPINDPNWEIWACSWNNIGAFPRVDCWAEMHDLADVRKRVSNQVFAQWIGTLAAAPRAILLRETPMIPRGEAFPLARAIEEFGRECFTSSISYLLAEAIWKKPPLIGIFGVDMAHQTEYEAQRTGAKLMIEHAKRLGINIYVPPESDLLAPTPLYGYTTASRHWQKLNARRDELRERIARLEAEIAERRDLLLQLRGALEDNDYHLKIHTGGDEFTD